MMKSNRQVTGQPPAGQPGGAAAGKPGGCGAMNDFPTETRPAAELRVLPGGRGSWRAELGKTYKKRPVVRDVTIELRRGEAVGLLGPNGAGKTTTFYMIVGLVQPDTGSISLDGADIT